MPRCDRCTQLGLDCIYPGSRKVNRGKRRQVRDLETKIRRFYPARSQPEQRAHVRGPLLTSRLSTPVQLEYQIRILGPSDTRAEQQPQMISTAVATGRDSSPIRPREDASWPTDSDHQYWSDRNSGFQSRSQLNVSFGLGLPLTLPLLPELRKRL